MCQYTVGFSENGCYWNYFKNQKNWLFRFDRDLVSWKSCWLPDFWKQVIVASETTEPSIDEGVAIWSKVNFCPQQICIESKPVDIETVIAKLNCQLFIIGCYVPPQVVSSFHDSILDFRESILSILYILCLNPRVNVVLCFRLCLNFQCSFC